MRAGTKPGEVVAWYIPQIPGEPFVVPVPDVATGRKVVDILTDFSAFEYAHHVKPDYADAAGVSRWETDGEGGHDWYEVDEDEDSDDEGEA